MSDSTRLQFGAQAQRELRAKFAKRAAETLRARARMSKIKKKNKDKDNIEPEPRKRSDRSYVRGEISSLYTPIQPLFFSHTHTHTYIHTHIHTYIH